MKLHTHLALRFTAVTAFTALGASWAGAQTLLHFRPGNSAGDKYGTSIAAVGDVDADGVGDIAVGAPFDDVPATNAGEAHVYSGRTLQLLFTWNGLGAGDRLGMAIDGVGDLDGDGHADVVVGANEFGSGAGYALVYSGATGTVMHTLVVPTAYAFGEAVAGGGDVDGDGTPDVLVGAPQTSTAGAQQGAVFAFSGATGALLRSHFGTGPYEFMGYSLAFLGDVDGDGRDEYISGSPGMGLSSPATYVRAYDGASGTQIWQDIRYWNDQYGWSVASIGDLSGDGIRDVLGGAPQDPGVGCACTGKGYVRVLDGLSGTLIRQINGASYYSGLGFDVASVGDLDADGYEDFAASAPATEGCGGNTQPVQIRRGSNGGLMLSIPTYQLGSMFGAALAFGDANGDGLDDLLVGVPCYDATGVDSGATYAYVIVRSVASYCAAGTNSAGCTPAMSGVGTPSVSLASPFDVRATSVLNQKSGFLFYGFRPRQTPFQGGWMCIVSPTQRTPLQNSGGAPLPAIDCSGAFSMDFNARIQSGIDPLLVSGEEVFAQYWSRDPGDPSTTNLTDALAFFVHP